MAGTIADKIQGILDAKTDIAAAIEDRGGTVPSKLSEYGNAIRELPAKYKEPADIEFIDYDGTILYEYTFAEIQELTELPALPTHENLVNEGWNYTLDELKNPIDYIEVAYTPSGISGAPIVTVRRYAKARLTDGSTVIANNTDYYKIISVTGGFTFDSIGNIYDTNGEYWGELATYVPASAQGQDLFGYVTQFFLKSESGLVTADIVSQTPHYDRTQKFTVGCTYRTADGYTRIHIHLDSSDKTFTLAFQQSASRKVFLDWGDGTTDTPGQAAYTARTHTYTFDGDSIDKTIILHPATAGETDALKFTGQICGNKTEDLKKITAIEIGDIGQISSAPFTHCSNLKALSIPSAAFSSGAVKQSVCQDFVGLECFVFPRLVANTGYYIPYDVQKLFFENCVSLKRVSLSNSVFKLGTAETTGEGSVFSRCKALQHICIPHNLSKIYNNAFLECLNLRKVYMHGRPYLGYTLFADCHYLDTCYVGMTYMDGAVFRDCCNLVSVTTEDGQSIRLNGTDNTFAGCTKLESVPPVRMGPKSAFLNCIKLEYLKCKDGTTFGQEAFKSSGLKTLDLSELSSNPIPTFGSKMLDNTRGDLKIIVPAGHLSDWQSATNWSVHASKMVEATT